MNRRLLTIRLYIMYNLIFFVVLTFLSCSSEKKIEVEILWENNKPIALQITGPQLPQDLEVRLIQNGERLSILGEKVKSKNQTIFKPIIPFTRGLSYEVVSQSKVLREVSIPFENEMERIPKLLSVYPSLDTLPENLLKIYLKFSLSMKEGISLDNIALVDANQDTLPSVFLNLQPELWNEDQTLLTIWLDPGRIKRDLIPNLEMGAPLERSQSYKLLVSPNWEAKNENALDQAYSKQFWVTHRDSISPIPGTWLIDTPTSNTLESLTIEFNEPLDYSLLKEVFSIKSENDSLIEGEYEIGPQEKSIRFVPNISWKPGEYRIQIESRLEDLAGNNLNRPFERDLENSERPVEETEVKILRFKIN